MTASGVPRGDRIEASQLKGSPVFEAGGSLIGTIQDLVIIAADGRVAEVIVWFGAASGTEASYYILPWSALAPSREGQGYVADPGAARRLETPGEASRLTPDAVPGDADVAARGRGEG